MLNQFAPPTSPPKKNVQELKCVAMVPTLQLPVPPALSNFCWPVKRQVTSCPVPSQRRSPDPPQPCSVMTCTGFCHSVSDRVHFRDAPFFWLCFELSC